MLGCLFKCTLTNNNNINRYKMKIITQHIYPPIPDRSHDWQACLEDWDIGDKIGYGATEEEAIEDLKEQLENK